MTSHMSKISRTMMLKMIGKLKNLGRAPGLQGLLKTVEEPHVGLLSMNPEQTSYSPLSDYHEKLSGKRSSGIWQAISKRVDLR